jgi:DNA-binding GntR family transcriptional regulator
MQSDFMQTLKLMGYSQSFESKSTYVERLIRVGIASGLLKEGERLDHKTIAAELGVSRTPIREALLRLQSQGFVEVKPGVGTTVLGYQVADVEDLYSVRAVLESFAIELAAPNLGQQEMEYLENHVSNINNLLLDDQIDYEELNARNRDFHLYIYKHCNNRLLLRFISEIWETLDLYRMRTFFVPGHSQNANREHKEMLNALRDKNIAEACSILRQHIISGCDILKKLITADSNRQQR